MFEIISKSKPIVDKTIKGIRFSFKMNSYCDIITNIVEIGITIKHIIFKLLISFINLCLLLYINVTIKYVINLENKSPVTYEKTFLFTEVISCVKVLNVIATINSEIDEIIEIIIDKSILLNIIKSKNNETQNVITILMINTIAVFFIKNKDKEYKI